MGKRNKIFGFGIHVCSFVCLVRRGDCHCLHSAACTASVSRQDEFLPEVDFCCSDIEVGLAACIAELACECQ